MFVRIYIYMFVFPKLLDMSLSGGSQVGNTMLFGSVTSCGTQKNPLSLSAVNPWHANDRADM